MIFEATQQMFLATGRGLSDYFVPCMNLAPVIRRIDVAALCCVGFGTCHRMKPADVPLAPSMAEVFLLADDPSGLRVYWADVTEDRASDVRFDVIECHYTLDSF